MSIILTYNILFFAALISGLVMVALKSKLTVNIKLLLSFSGSFLLGICFLHLIPHLYEDYSYNIGFFILIGFIFQLLLEYFSKGIEHGHFHASNKDAKIFPYSIFISLCLHEFIEGMVLVNPTHSYDNTSLLIGITIHRIPIAIILATMLLAKKVSKTTLYASIIIFATTAPLGLFLAQNFGSSLLENVSVLSALAVGILLHVSTTILFETSEGHKFNLNKFIVIVIGLLSAIIIL